MEGDESGGSRHEDSQERWPLVRVLDLAALVLVAVVTVLLVGGVVAAAGFPSFSIGFPSGSNNPWPIYSRIQLATVWAGPTTGLLLLASIAAVALPRIVRDLPPRHEWRGVASKMAMGICGIGALAAVAGVIQIGNIIWNTPTRSPDETWDVTFTLAAVIVNGLAALLSWVAIPYIGEGTERS